MRWLGYHGFEAITRLSTARNCMRTYGMVQVHTDCPWTSQDTPPSCSSRPLRSWIFFGHFHPVPREYVRLGALHHLPKNAMTYTRRHAMRAALTYPMSPKRRMVSPIRSAATLKSSTFRCRNSMGRSVEPTSPVVKCAVVHESMTMDLVVVLLVVLLLCRSFLSSFSTLGARRAKNCLCYQLLPFDSFFAKEAWPYPGHPWMNTTTLQYTKN